MAFIISAIVQLIIYKATLAQQINTYIIHKHFPQRVSQIPLHSICISCCKIGVSSLSRVLTPFDTESRS